MSDSRAEQDEGAVIDGLPSGPDAVSGDPAPRDRNLNATLASDGPDARTRESGEQDVDAALVEPANRAGAAP